MQTLKRLSLFVCALAALIGAPAYIVNRHEPPADTRAKARAAEQPTGAVPIPPFPFTEPEYQIYLADMLVGWYDLGQIGWRNERFWDVVQWLESEGMPRPTVEAVRNQTFEKGTVTGTLLFVWSDRSGRRIIRTDAADVMRNSESWSGPHPLLVSWCGYTQTCDPTRVKRYPGFDLRHPATASPIGAPWPEHPHNNPGRKIYHPSPSDSLERFQYGAALPQVMSDGSRHWFVKFRRSIGCIGWFGFACTDEPYWSDEGNALQGGGR